MSLKKYIKEILVNDPKEKAIQMVKLVRGTGIQESERYVELIIKKYQLSNH